MKGDIRKVPVVGYVENGKVHLPEGFLEQIESRMIINHGKQIFPKCSKCGQIAITRERLWSGTCADCKGETREDGMDRFPVLQRVKEDVLSKIRMEFLNTEKYADLLSAWGSGDIMQVSIILEMTGNDSPRWCYLYKSDDNTLFVTVNEKHEIKSAMKRFR